MFVVFSSLPAPFDAFGVGFTLQASVSFLALAFLVAQLFVVVRLLCHCQLLCVRARACLFFSIPARVNRPPGCRCRRHVALVCEDFVGFFFSADKRTYCIARLSARVFVFVLRAC